MGKVVRVSVLVLCLACSAQAGWIQNDVTKNQPSQPSTVTEDNGYIQNEEPASLTGAVLSVLEAVLALV